RAAQCPICGSIDTSDALTKVRDHVTLDVFRIVHCRGCDVRFTWPAPLNLDRYYPRSYRAYSGLTKAVLQALYRRRVGTWVRGAAPGHALKVGCGPGLMLDALRHRGWRATGGERTEALAAPARPELGLAVLGGGIEEVPADSRFDLI